MKILKEPFLHFLGIGLLIFLINSILSTDVPDEDKIIITTDDATRLSNLYKQNWNKEPDSLVLENLIQDYIISEVLYREALSLNLDHNDEIIKRRLRQKYEFLAEDLADLSGPSQDDLIEYYNENKDKYFASKSFTFFQFYINPDIHASPGLRANSLYSEIKNKLPSETSDFGDTFFLDHFHNEKNKVDVAKEFGIEFSEALFDNDKQGWTEPIRSGYGYHIVYIDEIKERVLIDFEDVEEKVIQDWKSDNRALVQRQLLKDLQEKYTVLRKDKGND